MEPITVKSDLDFKTYYKISIAAFLGPRLIVMMAGSFAIALALTMFSEEFNLAMVLSLLAILILYYGIIFPIRIYFSCKKNMRRNPVLAEGVTYYITDTDIEGITTTSNGKANWSSIKKVVEKPDYLLLHTASRAFRYLPKNGFQSQQDIDTVKSIVKQHNIKAYFIK